MKPRLTFLTCVLIGAGLTACGESEPVESEEAEEVEVVVPEVQAEEQPTPNPLARVSSGTHRGRAIGPTTVLDSGGAILSLDLREGARVSLEPSTRARLDDEARAQVVLAEGALHAVLPPMGGSPRPPLRIGTAAGTVEITGSGECFVLALADGSAWVAALAGQAKVHAGAVDAEPLLLTPGHAVVISASETTTGLGDLDAARAVAATLVQGVVALEGEGEIEARLAALDAAITVATGARAETGALQDRHAAAVSAMSAEARTHMQGLIAHSRELERIRGELLTAYERARAYALLVRASPDPTAIRRPRVRSALGLPTQSE